MIAVALAVMAMGQAHAAPLPCLKAKADLVSGIAARSGDFSPASCPSGELPPAFRHDGARGSILSRSLRRDEIVRAFPQFGLVMVHPGEKLRLVVSEGAMRVEREVEAIQAARPGQSLFVRAADGSVFSARYEVAQ